MPTSLRCCVLVVCLFVAMTALAAVQNLSPVTLEFGEKKTVADAPAGSAGSSSDEAVVRIENDRTLVGGKPGTAKVTFKNGNDPVAEVDVTVEEMTTIVELTRGGKQVPITGETLVFAGDSFPLTVKRQKRDGTLEVITAGTTTVPANKELIDGTIADLDVKSVTHTGIIDPPPPSARVDLQLPNGTTQSLHFLVAEKPATVTVDMPERLREETATPIQVKVTGGGGGIYRSTTTQFPKLYSYDCDATKTNDTENPLVTVRDETLNIGRIGPASDRTIRVKCSVRALDRTDIAAIRGHRDVTALQSGGRILLTPATLSLFTGQNSKVTAALVDRNGNAIDNRRVEWSIAGGADGLILAPQGDNAVVVTASKDRTKIPESGVINVTAKAQVDGGTEISAALPVSIVNASGFTLVRGALEMLDYETAKDLYGSRTAEDFYVAKITLMNDLDEKLAGASILVFSSSLGIGVNLQKAEHPSNKMRKRDVARLTKERAWKPITYADLRKLGLPINYPLPMDDVPRMVPPGQPTNDLDNNIIYTCDDIWYAEQSIQLTPQERESPDVEKILERKKREREDRVSAARLRQLRYRPYPYDMVIKSFDPRDNRTGRSLTFRALTFAGSVASFVTGVPNFGASEQLIAVNEKFGSVLVPALATFWPSTRETQRQNLVDDTMHPIEEIPYGASLTKMIFLPKYPFQGLAADYWFRISEICPFDFHVEVAISHKEKQVVPVSPIANGNNN